MNEAAEPIALAGNDIALAIAAVGTAVAAGKVTPAEAVELTKPFETAMRAIEKREHEYWPLPYGTRPPAAPPPIAEEPAPEPDAPVSQDIGS